MATKCDSPKAAEAIPYLENLEPRLLLTTLHGGEFFIYHNSQGDTIRVDLEGEPDDTVELLAHHALFGIVDLPGYGPYIAAD